MRQMAVRFGVLAVWGLVVGVMGGLVIAWADSDDHEGHGQRCEATSCATPADLAGLAASLARVEALCATAASESSDDGCGTTHGGRTVKTQTWTANGVRHYRKRVTCVE